MSTVKDIESFILSVPSRFPVRVAVFRFWMRRSIGAPPDFVAPNDTPHGAWWSQYAESVSKQRLDAFALERVVPVHWSEEIDCGSPFGEMLKPAVTFGLSGCGVTLSVRGPNGGAATLSVESEMEKNAWTKAAEELTTALQMVIQWTFVGARRLIRPDRAVLTPREKDCVLLMAQGKTVKETARELGLSDQTVTFYLGRLRTKLNAANTTQAVTRALEMGLISDILVEPVQFYHQDS